MSGKKIVFQVFLMVGDLSCWQFNRSNQFLCLYLARCRLLRSLPPLWCATMLFTHSSVWEGSDVLTGFSMHRVLIVENHSARVLFVLFNCLTCLLHHCLSYNIIVQLHCLILLFTVPRTWPYQFLLAIDNFGFSSNYLCRQGLCLVEVFPTEGGAMMIAVSEIVEQHFTHNIRF